jgi:hypothetical protein
VSERICCGITTRRHFLERFVECSLSRRSIAEQRVCQWNPVQRLVR